MACKLGALMTWSGITEADRALLQRWCEDGTDAKGRRVSAESMATAITNGTAARIGPTTLKDHRGGRCACYRKAAR